MTDQRPFQLSGQLPADIDVGLRRYMLRVYNYMAGGLTLTGIVAYGAVSSGLYQAILQGGFIWIVLLAPLALVMFQIGRASCRERV